MSQKSHKFLQHKKEIRRRVRATRRRAKRELAKQVLVLEGEEIAYFDELAREADEREFDRLFVLLDEIERRLMPPELSREEFDSRGDDQSLQVFCEEHPFG